MNSKKSFFKGLSLGLVVSFVVAGMSFSYSKKQSTPPTIQSVNNVAGNGNAYVSTDDANTLIGAYSSGFVAGNNLPANTTIGGFILRSELNSLVSASEENYVKYRFIMRTQENGDQVLGLALFPSKTSQNVLVTSAASSCPVVCDYPD